MKKIAVYCGSSFGTDPSYTRAACELGKMLAAKKIGLVYGGAAVGLMGEIARSALQAGGAVTGVLPQALANKGVGFSELTDLRIVNDMHERKALIADLSDGFIAMPGGPGTIEEFFEVVTWAQLGIHRKPCGLLNISGYFDLLYGFLHHCVSQNFMPKANLAMIQIADQPQQLLQQMHSYTAPHFDKAAWILQMQKNKGPLRKKDKNRG